MAATGADLARRESKEPLHSFEKDAAGFLAVAREAMRMMERVAHAHLVAAEISEPSDKRPIDLSPALKDEP